MESWHVEVKLFGNIDAHENNSKQFMCFQIYLRTSCQGSENMDIFWLYLKKRYLKIGSVNDFISAPGL